MFNTNHQLVEYVKKKKQVITQYSNYRATMFELRHIVKFELHTKILRCIVNIDEFYRNSTPKLKILSVETSILAKGKCYRRELTTELCRRGS